MIEYARLLGGGLRTVDKEEIYRRGLTIIREKRLKQLGKEIQLALLAEKITATL